MRQNWQLWEGALSNEQCDTFEDMCKHIELRDATIFKDKGLGADKQIRTTQVGFIDNDIIQKTMRYYLEEANKNAFGVDAHYLPLAQYGKYSEGSFYDWHYDTNWSGETAYDRNFLYVYSCAILMTTRVECLSLKTSNTLQNLTLEVPYWYSLVI